MTEAKLKPEDEFLQAWQAGPLGSVRLMRQHRFAPPRLWKFDFALFVPTHSYARIAIELEGAGPGHHALKDIAADTEKMLAAMELGWRVYRFPANCLRKLTAWGERMVEVFVEQICMDLCNVPRDESEVLL